MVQDFNLTRDEILALKEGDIFKYGGKDVEFISLSYISTKNSNKIWNIRYESVNEPSWGSFDVSDIMNITEGIENISLDTLYKIVEMTYKQLNEIPKTNEIDTQKYLSNITNFIYTNFNLFSKNNE